MRMSNAARAAGPVTIAYASWPNRSRPSIRPEASTSPRALIEGAEQAAAVVEPRRVEPAGQGQVRAPGSRRCSGRRRPRTGCRRPPRYAAPW